MQQTGLSHGTPGLSRVTLGLVLLFSSLTSGLITGFLRSPWSDGGIHQLFYDAPSGYMYLGQSGMLTTVLERNFSTVKPPSSTAECVGGTLIQLTAFYNLDGTALLLKCSTACASSCDILNAATYTRVGGISLRHNSLSYDNKFDLESASTAVVVPVLDPVDDSVVGIRVVLSVAGADADDRVSTIQAQSLTRQATVQAARYKASYRNLQRTSFIWKKAVDTHLYLVFDQHGPQGTHDAKIVRYCSSSTELINTHQELYVTCLGLSGTTLTEMTAAMFLPDLWGEPRLIASFRQGSETALCDFRLKDIESVMDKMKCTTSWQTSGSTAALQSPRPEPGADCVDGRCLSSPRVGRVTPETSMVGSVIARLAAGFNPSAMTPAKSQVTVNGQTFTDNIALLGSTTGQLGKIWLSPGSIKPMFSVESLGSQRIDQFIHNNRSEIIIQTASTIYRYVESSNSDCALLTSCDECTSAYNPYCGWCVLQSKCSLRTECSAGEGHWRRSSDTCPSLTALNHYPQLPFYNITHYSLEFRLEGLPNDTPLSEVGCAPLGETALFVPGEGTRRTNPETITFTCRLQNTSRLLQAIQDNNGEKNVTLVIGRKSGGKLYELISSHVLVYDCASLHACSRCAGRFNACKWSLNQVECVYNERCQGAECFVDGGRCPKIIDFADANRNQPLISVDSVVQNINLPAVNLMSGATLRCHATHLTPHLVFPAVFSTTTEVQCQSVKFTMPEGVGKLRVKMKVSANNKLLEGEAYVGVYDCGAAALDCSTCGSLQHRANEFFGSVPNCHWCEGVCLYNRAPCQSQAECPKPALTRVEPAALSVGSTQVLVTVYGTDLGSKLQDVTNVKLADINCVIQYFNISQSVTCLSGRSNVNLSGNVEVTARSQQVTGLQFSYSSAGVTGLTPRLGPKSGGTVVTLTGSNLHIGRDVNVFIGDKACHVMLETRTRSSLQCLTASVTATETVRGVTIDVDDVIRSFTSDQLEFKFTDDPRIKEVDPTITPTLGPPEQRSRLRSFASGGKSLNITGEHFNSVQSPGIYVEFNGTRSPTVPCNMLSDKLLICITPAFGAISRGTGTHGWRRIRRQLVAEADLQFSLDGAESKSYNILYYKDPTFTRFEDDLRNIPVGHDGLLKITGTSWEAIQDRTEVNVSIGEDMVCNVTSVDLAQELLLCQLPKLDPGSKHRVQVSVGNASPTVLGEIVIESVASAGVSWQVIVGSASGAVVVVIIIIIIVYATLRRRLSKREREYKKVVLQLDTLESNVRNECKQAFAELQTDMTDLTGDIDIQRIPYWEYKQYMFKLLFPGVPDHPCLNNHIMTGYKAGRAEGAMNQFHELLLQRGFALLFIRTLEEQRGFTIRDKANVASLLTVIFQRRMDYLTDILRLLLNELIERTAEKKLLFRRTESVVEKLLTCWLSVCMYPQLRGELGRSLYIVFLALRHLTKKGPVDAVTADARYALSEDKLLREKIEPANINVTIEQAGVTHSVRVLDTDTISQVKSKLCDELYKRTPHSYRPALDTLQLEWRSGHAGRLVMQDLDSSSEIDGSLRRLNTLKHYNVPRRVTLALVDISPASPSLASSVGQFNTTSSQQKLTTKSKEPAWSMPDITLITDDVFHLVKPKVAHAQPLVNNNKIISEIFLTRLLSTKGTLQEFIDQCFKHVLDAERSAPLAVKWLFDLLETAAIRHNVTDPEVLKTWKNNSFLLRFWVNLVKNPYFILDVEPNQTIDSSLSTVAQTLMDACSSQEIMLGKDSPSNKLLFAKDIPRYRKLVNDFYDKISKMPPVEGVRLSKYLNRLSENHFSEWNVTNALLELHSYARKYHVEIIESIEDRPSLHSENYARKLESIVQQLLE